MKLNITAKIARIFGGGKPPCQPSEKGVTGVTEAPQTEEYERCILCGSLTCIPVSMPIDRRENYEIGAGQVCIECARKRRKAEEQQTLSNEKILRAVEMSREKPKK